jgi:phosphoesterase RecJ-like protein
MKSAKFTPTNDDSPLSHQKRKSVCGSIISLNNVCEAVYNSYLSLPRGLFRMPLDWTPFVELVRNHQRFLIMTHRNPDGDALGSELALAAAIRKQGKTARAVIVSDLPPRYKFLDPEGTRIERFGNPVDRFRNIDAVIVVDTGTWNQLGDFGPFLKSLTVPRLVIDHHRTQDDLGGPHLVDTTAEAAGRLIYEACMALGGVLDGEIADALFLALSTDTGWFRHSNTTDRTFALAEELTRAGANPNALYDRLYERNPLSRLKLTGRVLDRIETLHEGKIVYSEIFLSDFMETGAKPPDTEDMINFPRSVEGSEVALMFIEQRHGTVKVSFRSRATVDVDKIAEQFAGGGHRLAAGATVTGTMVDVRQRVLEAVRMAVK